MKILVTPRSITKKGHPSLERLKEAGFEVIFSKPGTFPTEEELLDLLPGCAGYLAGVEKISATVLDAATDLKVISRNGTGVDSIDFEAADRNGVKVCRAEGANARGVAELTFAHMLNALRSISYSDQKMKEEGWERRKGIELEGRTLGLLGCGKIGRIVAELALAFDMKVIAYDPFADESFKPSHHFSFATMDEVLQQADIISLHCPAGEGGAALIDEAAISKMKDGVYLVNTARGSLIDPDAALSALESGKIAGITLDAFNTEPPDDWRLVKDSRVIATPHIGSFTSESVDRAMSVAVDHILAELVE